MSSRMATAHPTEPAMWRKLLAAAHYGNIYHKPGQDPLGKPVPEKGGGGER